MRGRDSGEGKIVRGEKAKWLAGSGQGQRSTWILKSPAATKILNFQIVYDSVNPSTSVGKQLTLGCSVELGSVARP